MTDERDIEPMALEAAHRIGDPEFAKKLEGLTEEQLQIFVTAVKAAMRRRRIMLTGTIATVLSILLGSLVALVLYAQREPGTFVGYVFLIPLLMAGANMWLFGWMARRIKVVPEKPLEKK